MFDPRRPWRWLTPLLVLSATCCGQSLETGATLDEGDGSSDPPAVEVECVSGTSGLQGLPDVEVRQAFSGGNGTFEDHCEGGNLVQYSCGVMNQQLNPMSPDVFPTKTGNVLESRVDCGGRCNAGACPNECPVDGDVLRVLSIAASGETVLLNVSSGWKYTCQRGRSTADYDCSTAQAGDEFELIFGPGGPCTHELGSLGLGRGTQSYCDHNDCVLTDP